jgi:hypothetical protein
MEDEKLTFVGCKMNGRRKTETAVGRQDDDGTISGDGGLVSKMGFSTSLNVK